MHDAVMTWLATVKRQRPELFRGRRVLECGAYDINGSPRPLFEECDYTGLDFRAGPGVDVVGLIDEYEPDQPFDVVVCCQTLEHDPYWHRSLWAMTAALKPGGTLILTWAGPGWEPHCEEVSPEPGYYLGLEAAQVRAWLDTFVWFETTTPAGDGKDAFLLCDGKVE